MSPEEGKQPRFALTRLLPPGHEGGQVRLVLEHPFEPLPESGKAFEQLRGEHLDGKQRDDSDQGAEAERDMGTVVEAKNVVVERVGPVPQAESVASDVGHRSGDIKEVLEEFGGDVFVDRVVTRKL